jgi:hypothetical protein
MSGINPGDEVRLSHLTYCLPADRLSLQKLVFESSEAVSVISTFDDLGLKEDLLRGIYAYSACSVFPFYPVLSHVEPHRF